MHIEISKAIQEQYPNVRLGVLEATNINNSTFHQEIPEKNTSIANHLISTFDSPQILRQDKRIQIWRDVYREMGYKPKKYPSTVEAMAVRVLKGKEIPMINCAVNTYLLTQLAYLIPIGGHDASKVNGQITLDLSPGGEEFNGIGTDVELTDPGEIVYKDDRQILTRRWNYRDCDAAKITKGSKDMVLIMEAPTLEISDENLWEALNHLEKHIQLYCSGTTRTYIKKTTQG